MYNCKLVTIRGIPWMLAHVQRISFKGSILENNMTNHFAGDIIAEWWVFLLIIQSLFWRQLVIAKCHTIVQAVSHHWLLENYLLILHPSNCTSTLCPLKSAVTFDKLDVVRGGWMSMPTIPKRSIDVHIHSLILLLHYK